MEKYLILLSPSLSQDLFGNNTISPPWQLFATSPVCFWHRHLHPPEKLHHKLYTFTFWSFFQNMFFVFTNIYTCLRNCTKTVHLHFFTIFFCKTCPLFTNTYTCLKNCTTKCTHSLVCQFILQNLFSILQRFTPAWKIAPQTVRLHFLQNMFFVLLTKIYTCLTYLQVSLQIVILWFCLQKLDLFAFQGFWNVYEIELSVF